jgi:DNA polymerase III alpha subunit
MKFLMLEDARGTVEVTVFPRAYARVGHRLVGAGPFLVTGRVRADHGALTLDARDVIRLET